MSEPSAPIGLLDSGLGGLSVLRAIRRRLPHEGLVYLADHAAMPFGERTREQVRARAAAAGDALAAAGCKAVVIACNTATAAAADHLRARLACPVIAMEPAVKPAAAATATGVIGVLGTGGTLASSRFIGLLGRYADDKRVVTRPAPELVTAVERGEGGTAAARERVTSAVEPLITAGADVIVLGCTHFPMLRGEIEAAAGPGVAVIDTGAAVAGELARRLDAAGLLNPATGPAAEHFYTSGEPANVEATLQRLWPGARLSGWPVEVARPDVAE